MLLSHPLFSQNSLEKLLKQYNTESIPYIYTDDLKNNTEKIIFLDARERNEYNVSHLKDAIFVGYDKFNSQKTIKKLPNKNAKIVVYCSLGIRSEEIAKKLKKKGYKNVLNLYGGIFEWKNNGLTVYKDKNIETEKIHAFNKEWGKWLNKGVKVYE